MISHHVFVGERLMAFSDAVFSIVATIMVIPLKLEESKINDTFNLHDYLTNTEFLTKLGIYVYAYIIVLDAWYAHSRIFRLVERVDDILSWLNLVVLLFVSFLPPAIVLVSTFGDDRVVITISSITIILINASMILLLFFGFRQRHTLHSHLTKNILMRNLKLMMYLPLLVNPILASFAILFAWVTDEKPEASETFFFMIGSFAFLGRFIIWAIQKKRHGDNVSVEVQEVLMKDVVSKERILAFSDGIFAIVGTIVVLDITTEIIPGVAERTHENVLHFLHNLRYPFMTYISSFFIIGLLWFVHHSMFHFIKNVTPRITVFNSLSLLLVGTIPFGAGLVSKFSEGMNTNNEITSIRTFSIILVVTGCSQLLLWAVAHTQKSQCLSHEIDEPSMELIQLSKLMIFPIIGLIFYGVTFASSITIHHFFSFGVFATPILFILPRLIVHFISRGKRTSARQRYHRSSSSFSDRFARLPHQIQGSQESNILEENEEEKMILNTSANKITDGSYSSDVFKESTEIVEDTTRPRSTGEESLSIM